MRHQYPQQRRVFPTLLLSVFLIAVAAACSAEQPGKGAMAVPVAQQVLTFPLVGTMNLATLDPARPHGYNETIVMNMLYSGLVRSDESLRVIPDQATWQISDDGKVYTFMLRPHITFSDGTPVTAQSYIYSWTRALRSTSLDALALFSAIVGADAVHSGKAQTLAGVKALNDTTLQVTLSRPAAYFLAVLTNPLFFPLNQERIARYGDGFWPAEVIEQGVGSGPFVLKSWQPTVQMVFVPNPRYYGRKTGLTLVVAKFVNDPRVAFKLNGVGQTDLVWNITAQDQLAAHSSAGFSRVTLLRTDLLFVDATKPPFDVLAVRQAFARAIDREAMIHDVFDDALVPATTILPPDMPGYQIDSQAPHSDAARARALLHAAYPDTSKFPTVTFSYPASLVSDQEAAALQAVWQGTLGVQVNVRAVEPHAYEQEMRDRVIQLGFAAVNADFPDPYAMFSQFVSASGRGNGLWHDASVERSIALAEEQSGEPRLALYHQAEERALDQAVLVPLDHPTLAALIPSWVRGVTLNGDGLYFGDWADVAILRH